MQKTSKQNLVDHLKNDINLKNNDFVWLHSGVVGLGLLEKGIETITEAFEEVLSKGALFIPTFTYSWCENKAFDPLISECPSMGSYASKVWKDSRFIRNNNPNFSVAMLRNSSNENLIEQVFTKGAEKSCFGKDSFFSNLHKLSKIKNGYIFASAKKGLKGCVIKFPKISVGATENILIAACFAKGETKLRNCAIEPEINDLIYFLKKLGCKIKRIGKRSINVLGVKELRSTVHKVIFDRIETGTYIIAAALTKGRLKIKNINSKIMSTEIRLLNKMGVDIIEKKNYIIASRSKKLRSINITTKPYPGFPTDMQAQIMVLMTKAEGVSTIKENIFENRFMHISELRRMGAHIKIKRNRAIIVGKKKLNGAELMATDLRASVSLVLAGLVASGKTIINRIYHLDRGYEKIETKLLKCGAQIRRLK